jgi:hypothetical protein
MDVRVPELEGADATREILERHPMIRIPALTKSSQAAPAQ